jgi:hypothetical protein
VILAGKAGIEKIKKNFQDLYFTQYSSIALVLNPPRCRVWCFIIDLSATLDVGHRMQWCGNLLSALNNAELSIRKRLHIEWNIWVKSYFGRKLRHSLWLYLDLPSGSWEDSRYFGFFVVSNFCTGNVTGGPWPSLKGSRTSPKEGTRLISTILVNKTCLVKGLFCVFQPAWLYGDPTERTKVEVAITLALRQQAYFWEKPKFEESSYWNPLRLCITIRAIRMDCGVQFPSFETPIRYLQE